MSKTWVLVSLLCFRFSSQLIQIQWSPPKKRRLLKIIWILRKTFILSILRENTQWFTNFEILVFSLFLSTPSIACHLVLKLNKFPSMKSLSIRHRNDLITLHLINWTLNHIFSYPLILIYKIAFDNISNSYYQFILRNRFQGIFWDQYHLN